MTWVLDASALLTLLLNESGAKRVADALDGARVSSVNWSEVVQKSLRRGVDTKGMREEFSDAGVIFEPFSSGQAELAAHLWEQTQRQGLSLADRACLALAIDLEAQVLTADRAWAELKLDIEVRLLR